MSQLQSSFGAFPHQGEGFRQQLLQRLPSACPRAQSTGLRQQLVIGQGGQSRLPGIHLTGSTRPQDSRPRRHNYSQISYIKAKTSLHFPCSHGQQLQFGLFHPHRPLGVPRPTLAAASPLVPPPARRPTQRAAAPSDPVAAPSAVRQRGGTARPMSSTGAVHRTEGARWHHHARCKEQWDRVQMTGEEALAALEVPGAVAPWH